MMALKSILTVAGVLCGIGGLVYLPFAFGQGMMIATIAIIGAILLLGLANLIPGRRNDKNGSGSLPN